MSGTATRSPRPTTHGPMSHANLRCIKPDCQTNYPTSARLYTCERCGGLLDVVYPAGGPTGEALTAVWDRRRGTAAALDQSGVWRFRELLPEATEAEVVTLAEGNTPLFDAPRSAAYAGMDRLAFKHLGMNPTGSFKDLGMTTGITQARRLGATRVACASTGNTSASVAAYAARAGMRAFVFVPAGQVALGKLSQALDYGATVLQLSGDFDDAMGLVREVTRDSDLYLLNSINPFRLEGQKTMAFELLQQRRWQVPDRVVIPGGNLGNSSAIAKGFQELVERGVIARIPKLTVVQAEGANPFYRLWRDQAAVLEPLLGPRTLASAIKIGNPVSWPKAARGLRWSGGGVEQVSEAEIADAKAIIGRDGLGCEPASAVTLAGIKNMVAGGRARADENVVAVLTGHVLKDPDYTVSYHQGTLGQGGAPGAETHIEPRYPNRIIRVAAERGAILGALEL